MWAHRGKKYNWQTVCTARCQKENAFNALNYVRDAYEKETQRRIETINTANAKYCLNSPAPVIIS